MLCMATTQGTTSTMEDFGAAAVEACTEELVSAALQQMDPSSSPGDDGIQAAVF